MNKADAARCIAAFDAAQPPVIDYEHQTLHAAKNGQPAPAAGFMRALRWHPGRGLFAEVELTQRARQLINNGEYRYFSPVFTYDTATGQVQRILMGALTNNPAISGMAPLAAAAAQIFHTETKTKETTLVNTETVGANHHSPAPAKEGLSAGICAALGLPEGASESEAIAACKALAEAAKAVPDPALFAPVETVKELQAQVAALTAEAAQRMVDDLIAPALADGRILPAQEAWARDLGKSNIAALKAYLDTATPVAALTGTQTGGKAPEGKPSGSLTAQEAAVAAACGIAPESFAAARAA